MRLLRFLRRLKTENIKHRHWASKREIIKLAWIKSRGWKYDRNDKKENMRY